MVYNGAYVFHFLMDLSRLMWRADTFWVFAFRARSELQLVGVDFFCKKSTTDWFWPFRFLDKCFFFVWFSDCLLVAHDMNHKGMYKGFLGFPCLSLSYSCFWVRRPEAGMSGFSELLRVIIGALRHVAHVHMYTFTEGAAGL